MALVLVVSWVIAGCGGGGGDSSSKADGLSKAQLTNRVNATCERANQAQLAALGRAGNLETPEDVNGRKRLIFLPPIQKEAEKVAELSESAADGAEAATIAGGIERAVREAREHPGKRFESAFFAVDKRAAKYGFTHCVGLIMGTG